MIEITRAMTADERNHAAAEISEKLSQILKTKGWDHVCSEIIGSGAITIFGDLASMLNCKIDEIAADKRKMFYTMNSLFVLETVATALKPLHTPNADVLFNAPQSLKINAPILGELTCADLNLFCCWCIMHGADSGSVRRAIRTKEQKILSDCEKKFGTDYYISHLIRALSGVKELIDHVIRPECQKLISGKDTRSVNSMADALTSVKPSKDCNRYASKTQFSSFAELANRKSA